MDTNLNENLCLATAAISCSPPSNNYTAIVNTGASDHYFTSSAQLLHIDPSAPRTNICTATGEQRSSSTFAQLAIPGIPTVAAWTGNIIPGFTNNLISLGKLCDTDCTAVLDKHSLRVHNKHRQCVLTGQRETEGPRLWRVNIAPPESNPSTNPTRPHLIPDELDTEQSPTTVPTTPQPNPDATTILEAAPTMPQPNPDATLIPEATKIANTLTTLQAKAYGLPSVPALIAYLHATAGYRVKLTWHAAVKRGAYKLWPGLTCGLVERYCPDAPETIQGRMAQPRTHIRSTRPNTTPTPAPTQQLTPSAIELHELPVNQLFTDDTGQFHPRARSGNQYIMVAS